VNMRQIAALAGVSPSTVSRVINGTKPVTPELRDAVLKVIEANGYMPNAIKRQDRTIAVVIPPTFTSHGWSGEILDGILDGAGANTITLIREQTVSDSVPRFWRQEMLRAGLKGVLIITTGQSRAIATSLRRAEVPFVQFGKGERTDHWVWCDNILVMARALDLFFHQGHRRIAFVGYKGPHPDHRDRLRAYRTYMSYRGLAPLEQLLTVGQPLTHDLVSFLDGPQPPTALFVAGTTTALFTLALLSERGMTVPGDIAFAAMGPHPVLEAHQPPFPLVQRRLREGAKLAVETLLSLAEEGEESKRVQHTLESDLVCGEQIITEPALPEELGKRLAALA